MNILVINNKSLGEDDVISIFNNMGHKVITYTHSDISMHHNDEVFNELSRCVEANDVSIVFSFNYYPIISYVLKDSNVKYISYVYDSPHIALYTCSIIFPCNYIFIFDYATYEELKNGGISTVYYLPLSINTKRVSETIEKADLKDGVKGALNAGLEVSFVGSLYNEKHNLYDRLSDKLNGKYEYVRGYLDSMVKVQSQIHGYFFLDKMLDAKILETLEEVYPFAGNSDSIATPAYVYSHYFMARKVTEIERLRVLKKVSEKFDFTLFTHKSTPELPKAHNKGAIDYYDYMPIVFNRSKINLNISLKSILTGIPLRCIDVMGCGGFLLTNYQADLFRHFEAGKHFDYYSDDDDLLRKIEYYLEHEDERMTIAETAMKYVKENHNLEDYLKEMLDFVMS